MLRDEIAKVVKWGTWGSSEELADAILALPEIVALAEKAAKWEDYWNNQNLTASLQKQGWLHKDDPVEGLVVEGKCPQGYRDVTGRVITSEMHPELCEVCQGTGTITRPLTVGECPDALKDGIDLLGRVISKGSAYVFLPSGARVRVKK